MFANCIAYGVHGNSSCYYGNITQHKNWCSLTPTSPSAMMTLVLVHESCYDKEKNVFSKIEEVLLPII